MQQENSTIEYRRYRCLYTWCLYETSNRWIASSWHQRSKTSPQSHAATETFWQLLNQTKEPRWQLHVKESLRHIEAHYSSLLTVWKNRCVRDINGSVWWIYTYGMQDCKKNQISSSFYHCRCIRCWWFNDDICFFLGLFLNCFQIQTLYRRQWGLIP